MALVGCPAVPPSALAPFEIVVYHDEDELLRERGDSASQPRVVVLGPPTSSPRLVRNVEVLRRRFPLTDVVVWAPTASAEIVRSSLQSGAREVVLDADPAAATTRVREILEQQQLLPLVMEHEDRDDESWQFEGLLSRSREMWDVFETCARTATTDASVLILGETGTGKDLLARAIHRRSGRTGRFVAVDCGAVPEALVDSQLFGHVSGAFTGAAGAKEGLFRHADSGTLLLDEIGRVPLEAQNRLLRTLQSSMIRPVGGHEEVEVDVRVIAATSTPLERAIEERKFREDLFYRLDVIRLIVPPLRARPEDIVFLFAQFLRRQSERYHVERPRISDAFLDEIQAYDWPGNVRELENFTERLVLTHPGTRVTRAVFSRLTRSYLGRDAGAAETRSSKPRGRPREDPRSPAADSTGRPLREVLEDATADVERAYLTALLAETNGRMGVTARRAGISRRTLLRKLKRLDIDRRSFRSG